METKTIQSYYPTDFPNQQPAFERWLKTEDPGFLHIYKIQPIGDGARRARDMWVNSREFRRAAKPLRGIEGKG